MAVDDGVGDIRRAAIIHPDASVAIVVKGIVDEGEGRIRSVAPTTDSIVVTSKDVVGAGQDAAPHPDAAAAAVVAGVHAVAQDEIGIRGQDTFTGV